MKSQDATRPLARSLAPLADESLPGFLLRLSHRLDQPPAEIAWHTGLVTNPDKPIVLTHNLLQMTAPTAHRFASCCRLTPMEAAALGMARPGGPYLPLDLVAHGPTRLRHTSDIPGLWSWVFTRATRYCPQCLAGDDSLIQQQHGGAWARSWRLPVVFACLRHQRLLASRCPDCRQRVQARSPLEKGLVPAADTVLHPAQCRSMLVPQQPATSSPERRLPRPRCGALLSAGPTHPPALLLDRSLLDLQRRLLALFTDSATDPSVPATSLGRPVTARQYFVDLRLMAVLIQLTWPHAAPLITSPLLADALDTHLHQQQRDREDCANQGRRPGLVLHPSAPPLDPVACAALLLAADRLLTHQASFGAGQFLEALIERAFGQRAWQAVVRRSLPWCSPGLEARVQTRMAQLRPPNRRGTVIGNRRHRPARGWLEYHRDNPLFQPDRLYRYQRQHVPQYLTDPWFETHLAHFTGIYPRYLRRATAIRLIQMTQGGSIAAIGTYLGNSPSQAASAIYQVNTWARRAGLVPELDAAWTALAAELDNDSSLIDYGRRRQAMAHWTLPDSDWQDLVALFTRQFAHRRHQVVWGQRKRHMVSALIWMQSTASEHRLCPQLVADRRLPMRQRHLSADVQQTLFRRDRPHEFHIHLHRLLKPYVQHLTDAIDGD